MGMLGSDLKAMNEGSQTDSKIDGRASAKGPERYCSRDSDKLNASIN